MAKTRPELDSYALREVAHRAIDALVVGLVPAPAAMPALFKVAAAAAQSSSWDKLARLRWDRAFGSLAKRACKVMGSKPLPSRVRALWFGMPEIENDDFMTDVSALSKFTPDDRDHEYGSGSIDVWPDAELHCELLKKVPRIVLGRDDPDDLNEIDEFALFVAAMGFTCFLAAECAQRLALNPRVRSRNLGVIAGPSGGEDHLLGVITPGGWRPAPKCWLNSLDPTELE